MLADEDETIYLILPVLESFFVINASRVQRGSLSAILGRLGLGC
jgi:hypothetical protein